MLSTTIFLSLHFSQLSTNLPPPPDSVPLHFPSERSSPARDKNQTWQNKIQGKGPHIKAGQGNLTGEKESLEQEKRVRDILASLLGVQQKQANSHNLLAEDQV